MAISPYAMGQAEDVASEPEALQLLKDMQTCLAKLPAYSYRFKYHNMTAEKDGAVPTDVYDVSVLFQRPTNLLITMKLAGADDLETMLLCDGKNVYTYRKKLKGYVIQPAREGLRMLRMGARDPALLYALPYLIELTQPDAMQKIINEPFSAHIIDVDTSRGYPRHHGCYQVRRFGGFSFAEVNLWVDEFEGFFPAKLTAAKPVVGCRQNVPGKDIQITLDFSDWNVSPTITEDSFKFTPPVGSVLIEDLN